MRVRGLGLVLSAAATVGIAAMVATAGVAFGAPRALVQWQVKSAPAKAVKAGAKFDVRIAGAIDAGWHLYALEEPKGGPIATEVALAEDDPADVLRVDESKPSVLPDPVFQQATGFFEKSAEFTLHLQLAKGTAAGEHPLHVLVRYQSCNDRVCLPPHTDTIDVPLVVGR